MGLCKVSKLRIRYEPYDEIVVKEYVRFDKIDDLIYIFAQLRAAGQLASANWANGVLFTHSMLTPDTDKVTEEFITGRLYYTNVSYALMPDYKSAVRYKGPEGEILVPVINVSSSKTLSKLAEWLKSQE